MVVAFYSGFEINPRDAASGKMPGAKGHSHVITQPFTAFSPSSCLIAFDLLLLLHTIPNVHDLPQKNRMSPTFQFFRN